MRRMVFVLGMLLAGCQVTVGGQGAQTTPRPTQTAAPVPDRIPASRAASNFRAVVSTVEPVAESVCRRRLPRGNCDFRIVIDDRPGQPPNAFQTLDKSGRPVIGFTVALIAEARNRDELAFVLGHEAAHHIQGHIPESQKRAVEGAVLGTVLGTVLGLDPQGIESAQRLGGTVGARRFAKGFELEADALGTVIAHRAGYDPVRGSQFFNRIPDPGDRFLGTHPPNADRMATVRRVAAGL